jgi:hypothetical protein
MRRIVFSLVPLDCDCQCCSFPIQRNRDKISTCKFGVGVFTQLLDPQQTSDIAAEVESTAVPASQRGPQARGGRIRPVAGGVGIAGLKQIQGSGRKAKPNKQSQPTVTSAGSPNGADFT